MSDEESVKAAIRVEVKRFKSHRGYTDELRKEFALAFQKCAPDAEIAHAIGERLLISCKYYPVPQQVHEAADAIRQSAVPLFRGLGFHCRTCLDTGFASEERDGISIAVPCKHEPPQNDGVNDRNSPGALDDYLTPEDIERWQHVAEHGKTKAARDIAETILKRHAARPNAEAAHA